MKEVIQLEDQFYVLATSSRIDDRTRVLKQGETFAVFDRFGDLAPVGVGELGLYHEDTRYLSRLALNLGHDRLLLLSSNVTEDNTELAVHLTNHDIHRDGGAVIPRGLLHVAREKVLWKGVCYERLRISNYAHEPLHLMLEIRFESDFKDIFEVGGTKRVQRGESLPVEISDSGVTLGYKGRDGKTRLTRIRCSPSPSRVTETEILLELDLGPKASTSYELTVSCETDECRPSLANFETVQVSRAREIETVRRDDCHIFTSNEQLNDWLNRSAADLQMMLTETPQGLYPYAGVPWFSTVFGRDGIITALETLWLKPEIARGVLAYLAANQATDLDPERDAEPGKILHETRRGEMATLGEVPFGRYYGSVDATPLFVVLAGAYLERTADEEFIRAIWPNVERALQWIDRCGDRDGDGLLEYSRYSPNGLVNQGWKDSQDAVSHADGTPARAPIALCEVQGYVFAARRRAAEMASVLGDRRRARELWHQSKTIQERFESAFWCEELSTYALALDGEKRPCRVRSSNPGHCLWAGLVQPERARRVADTLLAEDSFCGWGVRTLSAREANYNPMSYHNGSVWPHDNALIAEGMGRYRLKEHTARIFAGLFDASLFMELHRMPELFCGFPRRSGDGPTLYPVACSPQSWAAGAVFMLLRTCLGLSVRAHDRRIRFRHPVLPSFLEELTIYNLRVRDAFVDLHLKRHVHDVAINVLSRRGEVEVVAVV